MDTNVHISEDPTFGTAQPQATLAQEILPFFPFPLLLALDRTEQVNKILSSATSVYW